jgi:hypothetical protein
MPAPGFSPGKTKVPLFEFGGRSLMDGIQFARSTVVNFTILGPVTASWDDEAADLAPQQQLLLARLVYEGGKRVEQHDLMKVLSLRDVGLRRVVAELRSHLKGVMPVADPVPNEDHGYRLVLEEQQADVFRFRAKRDEALRVPGAGGVRLMRDALHEWGPDSVGLYGDCALTGLSGSWAATTRTRLGSDHRHAVVWCLQQEMDDGLHHEVLAECERRGASQERPTPGGYRPQVALLDEEFVELWMRAARRCGQPARAEEIGQWALEAAARHDKSADLKVRRLMERVRAEEPPGGTASRAEPATTGEPAAMRGSGSTFNFYNAGATIGQQIPEHHGPIINNYGSTWRRQAGPGNAKDPGEPDRGPRDHDA